MSTALQRRARLRTRATGESYCQALEFVRGVSRFAPVIPTASAAQTVLEGRVFRSLRVLHYPYLPSEIELPGAIEILRVHPARDQLTVDLAPGGAARTIATSLFPEVDPAFDELATDAAGLRMQALDDGVRFVSIGSTGSVIFRGVTAAEIRAEHASYYVHPRGLCLSEDLPDSLSPPEIVDRRSDHDGELAMYSSIVRRLGILKRLGATGIDAWRNRPGRIALEVWLPGLDEQARRKTINDLASPHFSPQWIYLDGSPDGRMGSGSHHAFMLRDGSCELDLRLFASTLA